MISHLQWMSLNRKPFKNVTFQMKSTAVFNIWNEIGKDGCENDNSDSRVKLTTWRVKLTVLIASEGKYKSWGMEGTNMDNFLGDTDHLE